MDDNWDESFERDCDTVTVMDYAHRKVKVLIGRNKATGQYETLVGSPGEHGFRCTQRSLAGAMDYAIAIGFSHGAHKGEDLLLTRLEMARRARDSAHHRVQGMSDRRTQGLRDIIALM